MAIFLHILIGLMAFVGAGVLSISFMDNMQELNAIQKWSMVATVSAIGITAVFGFYIAAGPIGAVLSAALLAIFEYECFFKIRQAA
ncbi:hypothetical protein OIT44_06365 [Weissella ceti]|uniref:Uncharacterized protein n=1 Tax=Weissella ceti TaxID=759620 RepID=A0ABT3E5J1_9LACO|nr:hypothetical protein [Weissella ceti]MCW0953681.1 hypothetical protein [Weissella ceti]QVK12239.1 hypothetical protein KHQ31_00875 [Weissella ceti]